MAGAVASSSLRAQSIAHASVAHAYSSYYERVLSYYYVPCGDLSNTHNNKEL